MARLILSAGMFSALAAAMAVRRRGLVSGSPPFFAAMLISLIRRVKILPRLASSAPFLCLIVAHLEWPDMVRPRLYRTWMAQDSPSEEITGLPRLRIQANRNYSMPHQKFLGLSNWLETDEMHCIGGGESAC